VPTDLLAEVDGACIGLVGLGGGAAEGGLQLPGLVVPHDAREGHARPALERAVGEGLLRQAAHGLGELVAGCRAEDSEELLESGASGAGGRKGERGVDGERREDEVAAVRARFCKLAQEA
jgi:hypothetical protein